MSLFLDIMKLRNFLLSEEENKIDKLVKTMWTAYASLFFVFLGLHDISQIFQKLQKSISSKLLLTYIQDFC